MVWKPKQPVTSIRCGADDGGVFLEVLGGFLEMVRADVRAITAEENDAGGSICKGLFGSGGKALAEITFALGEVVVLRAQPGLHFGLGVRRGEINVARPVGRNLGKGLLGKVAVDLASGFIPKIFRKPSFHKTWARSFEE